MRPKVLGAVEREEWERVDAVAKDLWRRTYWNSFHHLEHLKGWLLTNFHCGYCGVYLPDSHIQYARAHTDHLLPHCRYPELKCDNMMNAVAACDGCNFLKGAWDPNTQAIGQEVLYTSGGELSYAMRLKLVERARAFFKDRTWSNRGRDERYMTECRVASDRAEFGLA